MNALHTIVKNIYLAAEVDYLPIAFTVALQLVTLALQESLFLLGFPRGF